MTSGSGTKSAVELVSKCTRLRKGRHPKRGCAQCCSHCGCRSRIDLCMKRSQKRRCHRRCRQDCKCGLLGWWGLRWLLRLSLLHRLKLRRLLCLQR